jgi:hypothetical protein
MRPKIHECLDPQDPQWCGQTAPADYVDPIVADYMKDIDLSLIDAQLRKTVAERIDSMCAAIAVAWKLRGLAQAVRT